MWKIPLCEPRQNHKHFARPVWRGTASNINAHESAADRSSDSLSISATFIMTTEWQNPPGADVILRASGGKEFHAHKLVLSLASSVFRDMFSVPPPGTSTESPNIPVVDIHDPPEALEAFLQIIYPIPDPPINDVETLASLIRLADKYDAKAALDAHKDYLLSACTDSPPIHVYAILCACDREKEAEAAARRVPFASLTSLAGTLLHLMTVDHYQRLMRFMVARDTRMWEIMREHQKKIAWGIWDTERNCYVCGDSAHQLYSSTIVTAIQAAFEANPCVRVTEALGIVSNAPLEFWPCGDNCRYNVAGLQAYAEGLLKDLVEMAENISWES